ncbi:Atlastin-1 [Amphibalanus amphitrite]|uniref:Atlastin-1 n=1 Tax=Amphibalanus amphitrite TaxID=1232801 RepID=A0A6A4VYY3_AMPAM|nr:Atlastin-1 [Amphibalanus amphitrite]
METEDSDGFVPGSATHSAAAPADGCVGAAGVAAWSQLLPVELPEGGRAALLLLDAWGPLARDCPAQLRTSVTLFSALVSSSLMVHTSAGFPVQPLDDLLLLGKLSAAAHEVRHCMPLQQLVLLLRDWPGQAPPGLQDDFKPLYQWADSSSDAKQALHVMMDTTDLYDMGDAALFLAAGRTPRDDVTPEHVKMLAKVRAVKRFGEKDITAGELADYLESLGSALNATQCDAHSLIRALVECQPDASSAICPTDLQEENGGAREELGAGARIGAGCAGGT